MTINWYNISMTSNATPSPYKASASTENGTMLAWKAFRSINVNSTDTSDCWLTASGNNTGWIQIDFGEVKNVNSLTLRSRSGSSGDKPMEFEVTGSNDGVVFNTVFYINQTDVWTGSTERQFSFDKTYSYRFYRLNIIRNSGHSVSGIARVLYGFDESIKINKTLILSQNEYKKVNYKYKTIERQNEIMTSNTAPAPFAVRASGVYNSYSAWRAFEGKFGAIENRWSVASTTGWIEYEFDVPIYLTQYRMLTTTKSANGLTAMPKDWTIQGSNNGVSWETIDIQNNITDWQDSVFKEFDVEESDSPYKIFRMNILANNGDNTYIGIYELNFIGVEKQIDGISNNWDIVSSYNEMDNEKFISKGMDSLSPLLDREVTTLEPQKMDKSEILLNNGKLFTKSIDLKKYIDIRNIKVEVE